MKNDLPKTITKTMYLGFKADFGDPGDPHLFNMDMSDMGYVMLGTTEVTYTIPDVDPTLKHIEALEAQRRDEMAQSQHRLDIIDDKIAKLRAITHQPESSDA